MRLVSICILSVIFIYSHAQETQLERYAEKEKALKLLFDQLYSDSDTVNKESVADIIAEKFAAVLQEDESFDYRWSNLDKIGKIGSEDNQVKIFTWHLQLDKDNYLYYGFIQLKLKRDRVKLFRLQDFPQKNPAAEMLDQSIEAWHGKLYYSIIQKHYRRDTYYTLLGMDFNDALSTMKTIEVLTIRRNRPDFAKHMFFNGKDYKDRVVLEYSSQVAISVRYNGQMDMIVYDHLIPLHPVYKGNYMFYGPDGSYDGYEFIDGTWMLREDVDARNVY